eukprot:9407963-Pyramimonas_sp.AAC.2
MSHSTAKEPDHVKRQTDSERQLPKFDVKHDSEDVKHGPVSLTVVLPLYKQRIQKIQHLLSNSQVVYSRQYPNP